MYKKTQYQGRNPYVKFSNVQNNLSSPISPKENQQKSKHEVDNQTRNEYILSENKVYANLDDYQIQ